MTSHRTLQRLRDGADSVVFRGVREPDGEAVVVKQLRKLYPSAEQIAALQRELDLTNLAASEGVVKALGIEQEEGVVRLVVEDFGASSLASQISDARPSLAECLEIAVAVTKALAVVHERQIVHKDINPSNIVRNPETGQVKLIDFGISSMLRRESVEAQTTSTVRGTPAYMSPEQTGRMNVALDYRTDLYSFGVTLYELLTGKLPFAANDTLEFVHAHIAKTPLAPHEVDAEVPETLSKLVMRLLEKRADDRYQSASGLLFDLERAKAMLEETGRVGEFELGTRDQHERFVIPQTLYGRRRETAALLGAFQRVAAGATEALLVAGYSGIGKTTLVNEVQRSILECSGVFGSGKCDQFKHGVPYDSLAQAFRAVVTQILREDEAVRSAFKSQILEAVGANGRVLTDLVQEVETLIGPQPALAQVSSTEAENRLRRTMRHFVRAISGPSHPLIMFLDDLQWADLPSLRLIKSLASDREISHVLFIGAYRDNEVNEAHPVTQIVREMREASVVVRDIQLGPLRLDHVAALLADTTGRSAEEVGDLAELCLAKTRGNPFFLNRFLESLHQNGLLKYDPIGARWTWDIEQLQLLDVTENVVDFMCKAIGTLSPATQDVLQLGSVIGSRFALGTVVSLLGRTARQVQSALREALDEDLIRPEGSAYWEASDGEVPNFEFRFSHDRIQQAAYSLIPDRIRRETHLKLGWALLDGLTEEALDYHLFDIVEHFNEAAELIKDTAERDRVSRLNYAAGQRALQSAAYAHGYTYFRRAAALSGRDAWERDYAYALDVGVESARAAYLTGDSDAMDQAADEVLAHSRSPLDSFRAQEVRALSLVGRQKAIEALELALETMASLGHTLIADPTAEDVEQGLVATLGLLNNRSNEEIAALPETQDPVGLAIMRLEVAVSAAAFLARPRLLALLAFDMVNMSVRKGVARQSAYGFGLFGLFLSAINLCDIAYKQSELALLLLDRFGDRSLRPRPHHLIFGFTRIWNLPLRETLEDQRDVYLLGMDNGDVEYGCWGMQIHLASAFWAGVELEHLRKEFETYVGVCFELQQDAAAHVMVQIRQAIENLTGRAADPTRLIGPDFHEEKAIEGYQAINYRSGVAVTYAMAAKVRFLFGDYPGASDAAIKGLEHGDAVPATFMLVACRFYGALAALQLCADASVEEREQLLASVDEHRAMLELWSGFCAANHAHRVALIDAERARVEGDLVKAMDKYDEAIELARAGGFVQHEGLACELCGRFYSERGRRVVARAYLMEARAAYQRWGATAKVDFLEAEYPGLSAVRSTDVTTGSLTSTVEVSTDSDLSLDVQSLFKATAALASEMRIDALLERVLAVAMQNAGATQGYLMLARDGVLRVEVAEDVDGSAACERGTPIDDVASIPSNVVRQVFDEGAPLVVEDARHDRRFQHAGERTRSVLCIPVAYQGKRVGVVYLENNLMPGAFTPERLMVLDLLSTQAAVAIENARLYEETRRMAASFERFVPKEFLPPLGRERVVDLVLGDAATHQITAMFIDLRGFTALFERLDPKEGYRMLIEYFGRMSPIIRKHQGIVIQFLGDGIMASFMGAADAAVDAVIEMVRSLEEMNREREIPGVGSLQLGAGLHSGQVMLATIGSEERLDITAVGDTVNSTARIEAATKALGAPVLISEEVMWRMLNPSAYDLRELGKVRVHGRKDPLALVEVFDCDPEAQRSAKRETLPVFEKALSAYRAGRYTDAVTGFNQCLERCPTDKVAGVLRDRAQQRAAGGSGAALAKGDVEFV
ncbi:MAG: AAA family ATPase [Polyangiaceae bacterium]